MLTWLLKSIGVSDDYVIHLNDVRLDFHDKLALWIGLCLLVPVGYFIYQRQQRNLRTVRFVPRLILTTIRVLILAMLVLVLAGPYLKLDQDREKKPIVALVFDHSQSMELQAGPFEPESELVKMVEAAGYRVIDGLVDANTRKAFTTKSRAKLVHDVVEHKADKLLVPLAKKFDLQYYSVADDVLPFGLAPGKIQLPEPPQPRTKWGTQTRLGDAVHHVLREAAGRPVAGIILFSDGQNTGGSSFPEAARAAAAAETPIFAVPAGNSKRHNDVAIVDVFTTGLVSLGDTAHVAVTVESRGFDGRAVKVQLLEEGQVVDSKDLVLRGAEQQQVELTYQAKKAGPHFLKVKVPPLAEEPKHLHKNNEDDTFIRVTEDKLRVLYLEGLPRWDFRFLKNAMRRDAGLGGRAANQPDIVLEAEWKRLPESRQALALPKTLEELTEYHTVILGDVSPRLLSPQFLDLLVKAVREKGVGLVIEGGPNHMPHDFDKRLLEMLPVRLRLRDENDDPVRGLVTYQTPYNLEVTPQGSIHDAMRFYDDPGRNQNAWSYMPPYFWCVAATRPSPAATVLARNPNVKNRYGTLPLISYQYAGKGRVMLVGMDSTWLWRQNVGDRYFYKFWGQAIRFVGRRDLASMKKSWMEVRPLRAQPGERASIELMAFKKNGSPRTESMLPVQVSDGKKTVPVKLTADPAVKGRYTGNFLLENLGEYRVTYPGASGTAKVEGKVRVVASIEELRHPHVDRVALQRLGDSSGGQMVELPDLGLIADKLKGETKSSSLHYEKDIWDNWLVLCVLVFLYSLDVGMRRLAGLA